MNTFLRFTYWALCGLLLTSSLALAQAPLKIIWDKTIGGSGSDNATSITSTLDGGFVIAGRSVSYISGDKSENGKGADDYWIVKLNANGQKVWDKTIGGSNYDDNPTLISTIDGGFVIAGVSNSNISGDKSENSKGGYDYWVVKLNANGQKVWDKTIGGNSNEYAPTITSTSDGGFVIAGHSASDISGDKSENSKGDSDYWIVKLNVNGQKVWDKTIGGASSENYPTIVSITGGGFIIAGSSFSSISGDKSENGKGGNDYWIVKLNANGQKVWDKTIGGSGYDDVSSITNTTDGGFVIAGNSDSPISGDKSENSRGLGYNDYWILKLNADGQKVWDKTIGGSNFDEYPHITSITGGGLVLAGRSKSPISGDKTENSKGDWDIWIVKLNANGQKVWDKTIGGRYYDTNPRIIRTSEGFVIAGTSDSNSSVDKSGECKLNCVIFFQRPINGSRSGWILSPNLM